VGDQCIKLWRWDDAPEEYRKLSTHCGDEDYILYAPAIFKEEFLPYVLQGPISGDESYVDGFGKVDRHELENGDVVVIFAHA